MNFYALIPISVGVLAVIQAALNRRIAGQWGLGAAVLLNACVLLACAVVFVLVIQRTSMLELSMFRLPDGALPRARWWFVLPGIFGFALVFSLPWALSALPSSQVFVLLIGTQIATSFAWDYFVEDRGAPPLRWFGAALAIIGAVLVSWRR